MGEMRQLEKILGGSVLKKISVPMSQALAQLSQEIAVICLICLHPKITSSI